MARIKKLSSEEKAMAVARLTKAQEEQNMRDFRTGMDDGRNWAVHRGDCSDLEALDWLVSNCDLSSEDQYVWDRQQVFAGVLARQHADQFGKELVAAEVQRSLFPPNRPHTAGYVNGFQLGASFAWDELKPLVKAGLAPKA